MAKQGIQRTRATGAARVPWWSSSASQRLVKFAMLLLLELLPVEAVLVVFTGYSGKDITQAPIPFWFLCGALLLARAIGRYLIGGSLPRLLLVSLPVFIPCALLLIRISPAAYGSSGGSFDWNWFLGLYHDLVLHTPETAAIGPLLVVLIYLWWRGLRLGSEPPEYSAVMRSFKYGMIVMVAVVAASIAIQGAPRQQVLGLLGLALPLEVFCGLVAVALARISMNQQEHLGDTYLATSDRLWFGSALTLAGLAVGFALLLNLIINYQSVGALLTLLGPVGPAINTLTKLFTEGVAQVLRFLFDWLIQPLKAAQGNKPAAPLHLPKPPQIKSHPHQSPISNQWLAIARLLLEGAAIVFIVVLFLWLVRTIVTHRRPTERLLDEERESLDAASLFGAQLRAVLRGLRRQPATPWVDPLTPGSVRYLYRGVLETADRQGMPRQAGETPDEYSARLASSPLLAGQSSEDQQRLATLNEAYNTTRYADRTPTEQELPAIREQAQKLLNRLLRRNPK